jgi:hypothetical protein
MDVNLAKSDTHKEMMVKLGNHQEGTKSDPEQMKANPEMMQSVGEHQESLGKMP